MNIINILTKMAHSLPSSHQIEELVALQPEPIQSAIKTNDSDTLKKYLSDIKFYAHETLVTLY